MHPLTFVEEVVMKKILLVVFITPLLILLSIMNLRAEEPDKTVIQFFEASKNGDVETMKRLSAGPFYNRRKALLERTILESSKKTKCNNWST